MNLDTPAVPADTCEEIVEARWAQFAGSYRSQDKTLRTKPAGKFVVVVFDQGEPGAQATRSSPGTASPSNSPGAPYAGYTRAGYIEGGNIQVEIAVVTGLSGGVAWLRIRSAPLGARPRGPGTVP